MTPGTPENSPQLMFRAVGFTVFSAKHYAALLHPEQVKGEHRLTTEPVEMS